MMLPADVLKIKCKFVQEVINYLNKRKYSVSPCIKCKYTYYADALKLLYGSTTTVGSQVDYECLSHDIECDLTSKANKYTSVTSTCTAETIGCNSQATITLSSDDQSCTSTAWISSTGINGGPAFPNITLTNNSSLVSGNIWLGSQLSGVCGSSASSVLVQGGCTSGGCSSNYKSTYQFGVNSTGSPASTTYIKTMRIYETDSLGSLGSKTDLDLDPSTSPYYADDVVACPGCTTVLAAEVQIGHANFQSAFADLMDNVSLALFGTTALHGMSAIGGSSSYKIRCKAKHNPSSNWFGLHYPDMRIVMSNGTVHTTANGFSNLTTSQQDLLRFYYNSSTFSPPGSQYDCADITPELLDQTTYVNYNVPASSFNKIVLLSNVAGQALGITQSESCGPTILTATYTADSTVDSVVWTDPDLVEISTTDTAIAEDTGTYTFTITLDNGCEISKTILVD